MNDALELLVLIHEERGDILTLHEYPHVIRDTLTTCHALLNGICVARPFRDSIKLHDLLLGLDYPVSDRSLSCGI